MSLSDKCLEALENLQNDFVSYADWDYEVEELSRIVQAMYELGTFFVRQNFPPDLSLNPIDEIIDEFVVIGILEKAQAENSAIVCSVVAEISKVNPRLNQGIDSLFKKWSSEEKLFDVIKKPHLFSHLQEIYKIKKSSI